MVAELTRLGQTLLLVSRIHWLVPEDSYSCSKSVTETLKKIGNNTLQWSHVKWHMIASYCLVFS